MDPGTSVLLQRLQNFLPQIKQANEAVEQQMKQMPSGGAESICIDEGIIVEDNQDSDDSDVDNDSDVESDDGQASKKENHKPEVEIKLAFGQVDDDLLEALGEKPDSSSQDAATGAGMREANGDAGADAACSVGVSSTEAAVIRSLNASKAQSGTASAAPADSSEQPALMREVTTRKKKA